MALIRPRLSNILGRENETCNECTVPNGCGGSFSGKDSGLYNCCYLTRYRHNMLHDRELVPLNETVQKGQTDVAWLRTLGVELVTEPCTFRGSWRSKHRRECIEGLYVPWWIGALMDCGLPWLEWKLWVEACMAREDIYDATFSMLALGKDEEIVRWVRSQDGMVRHHEWADIPQ